MPSIINAGSFLSLFDPANWISDAVVSPGDGDMDPQSEADEDPDGVPANLGPFSWPAWQARTGIMLPIFSPTPHAGTPMPWRSRENNEMVWCFVTTYWKLQQAQKVAFIARSLKDNNSIGRILFLDWFKAQYATWSINDAILSSLSENGVDPYSVLKLSTNTKVWPLPKRDARA
jgi:hypothetical protein